ncbi:MAG: DUF5682 family protein [Vulcanimicrobiota bacterium]
MMVDALFDLTCRPLFFPVRHHSPLAAAILSRLIRKIRPAMVLIEGPSDFNDHLSELSLPHRLPIAIYAYYQLGEGRTGGAYYPFCEYSPEWQALRSAESLGIPVSFIDIPHFRLAGYDKRIHRYSDLEFRRSPFIERLCEKMGLDDFDALWDELFEIHGDMSDADYMERMHRFCYAIRSSDPVIREHDLSREAFMAGRIQEVTAGKGDEIIVVTGGYHSSALYELVVEGKSSESIVPSDLPDPGSEGGIALTPYSYERLDGLTGYEAGMPNPGFYHILWTARGKSGKSAAREVMALVAELLRKKGQPVSAADLISCAVTSEGLADIRGHHEVWRGDILDAFSSVLIKEDMPRHGVHPLLEAVYTVLRGGQRGALAEGSRIPPLVQDIDREMKRLDIELPYPAGDLHLEVHRKEDREKSIFLHRAKVLSLSGFRLIEGRRSQREDGEGLVRETWNLCWSPDFQATSIEASRYGSCLVDACLSKLKEQALALERDSMGAASLLLDAFLAEMPSMEGEIQSRLGELIREDGSFEHVTQSLSSLLTLHCYASVLSDRKREDGEALLQEAFLRSEWLIESPGALPDSAESLIAGLRSMRETFERAGVFLGNDREEFTELFRRVQRASTANPLLAGAATGMLLSLSAFDDSELKLQIVFYATPERLGDFLSGLFALARESVQRNRQIIRVLHQHISGYSSDSFFTALPSLRLAFSFFTPREKHHFAMSLREILGLKLEESGPVTVDPERYQRGAALEARIFDAVRKYGLEVKSDGQL